MLKEGVLRKVGMRGLYPRHDKARAAGDIARGQLHLDTRSESSDPSPTSRTKDFPAE